MGSQMRSSATPSTISEQHDTWRSEICVICRESVSSRCEARPCGHNNFDYLCLVTWLEFRARCPLCQSTVDEVWYRSVEEDGGDLKTYKVPRPSQGSVDDEHRQETESLSEEEREWNQWLLRRCRVYQENLYALHVGSNRRQIGESQYTELSPELFNSRPELVSRARTWLCRELRIFTFLHRDAADPSSINLNKPTKVEWVREYIIFLLKSIDTQDHTGYAEHLLSGHLPRDLARHLLHELRAWLRSPFQTPDEWYRAVQYPLENVVRESEDRFEDSDRESTPRRESASRREHRITKTRSKNARLLTP
ncbi:RING U-box [Naviculisporaceae sp. PSN 640]